MVVNVAVASTESRYAKRLRSEMLAADSRHTLADVLVTATVLVGLVLVSIGWTQADAWLAIFVAAVIAHSGWEILRRTVPVLVDHRAIEPSTVRDFVLGVEGVADATDIRSRGRPGEAFAELTILVDPSTNVREAHGIADAVERRLTVEKGFYGVVVHTEPQPD